MMRLRSRYLVFGAAILVIFFLLFLLQSQILDPSYEVDPPGWSQTSHDTSLDELLDESFTRPPDSPVFHVDVGRLPAGVVNFGIVEKRLSPLCPDGALESPVSGRVRTFQGLTAGGDMPSPLLLYSASLQLLPGPSPQAPGSLRVLLTAFVERGFHAGLFCQLWYRSGPRPLSLLPLNLRPLSESAPDAAAAAGGYRSSLAQCVEDDVRPDDTRPYAVSLVPALRMCASPENVLPFIDGGSGEPGSAGSAGIAVCCPSPLDDRVAPGWLTEWLEAQRVFGAKRVFLYLLRDAEAEPSPSLFRALRAFTKPGHGLVTLLDWPLPAGDKVPRQGRTLAANDCLRRAASAGFARVVFSDLDKLLVPGSRHADWPSLFRLADPHNVALLVSAAIVSVATEEEREALGGSPLKLSVRRRSATLRPAGDDMNVVVDPARVLSVGGDGHLRHDGGPENVLNLGEEDALMFHYDPNSGTSEWETVIDERLAPFTFRLVAAVNAKQLEIRRS